MFYSHFVYVRDGPLAKIWLAAHVLKQLNKADIAALDITKGAAVLMGRGGGSGKQAAPFALRVSGQLLLGLVRIYEKKVNQAVEDAEHVHSKLRKQVEDALPRGKGRKSGAAANNKTELSAEDLRVPTHNITYADNAGHEYDDATYTDLGTLGEGLDPLNDFDENGMVGFELINGDVSGFGEPDFEVHEDESGPWKLTAPTRISQGRTQNEVPMEDETMGGIDDELPHDDLEDGISIMGGDESTRIEDGRANISTGLGGDSMNVTLPKDLDNELLPGSDIGDYDGGFGLLPGKDSRPASVAVSIDEIDGELGRLNELLVDATIVRAAKKKRKATAFAVIMDDVTEISKSEINRWLQDTSDIVTSRSELRLKRSAKENLEHLSQASSQQEDDGSTVAVPAASSAVPRHLFDLPATGLGHAAYGELSNLTRLSLRASDAGRFAPRLVRLLQSRLTTVAQLPGLPYAEFAEIDDHVSVAGSVRQAEDGSIIDDVGGIGMEDIGMGTFDMDPFTQTQAPGTPMQIEGPDGELLDGGEIPPEEEEEKEEELEQELEERSIAAPEYEGEGGEDHARKEARDVSSWWSEKGGLAEAEAALHESIESGWSRRTKKMHTLLKDHMKGSKPLSFEGLVKGHVKAVAAGSFYQLLVLASGGFLQVKQTDDYGDIMLAKTSTFEKKLPKVPNQTPDSRNASHVTDSQASELH